MVDHEPKISRRAFFSAALASAASALGEANLASAYNDNIRVNGNVIQQRKFFPQSGGELLSAVVEVDQDSNLIDGGTSFGWYIQPGSVVTLFDKGDILVQQPERAPREVGV